MRIGFQRSYLNKSSVTVSLGLLYYLIIFSSVTTDRLSPKIFPQTLVVFQPGTAACSDPLRLGDCGPALVASKLSAPPRLPINFPLTPSHPYSGALIASEHGC
ncbi:hypothetical protein BJX70DRAFT_159558 [Aspergillus crustosus]